MTAIRELTVDDLLDLRAYERVRGRFREEVMRLKALRRVALGPIVTVVFECAATVQFQVQEMARAERIVTEEGLQTELDVYNRLLPTAGELSATLFIELTSEGALREWLPKLVGIEHSLVIELRPTSPGSGEHKGGEVRSVPESSHAEALTREEVTPAVHYLRLLFEPEQVPLLASGPAMLAVRHPAYDHGTELSQETRQQLVADLEGRTPGVHLG